MSAVTFDRLSANVHHKDRDLRSFEIRIRIGARFDSKVMGRFQNFQIESAVPTHCSS